jgi:hypothetical protein
MKNSGQVTISGWREWVELPDLGVSSIDTKMDTGMKDSVLHTSFIEHYRRDNDLWVRFGVNILTGEDCHRVVCQAPIKTTKVIPASDNHDEPFFVIETEVKIGNLQTRQDIILKNQGNKKHVMHLGRSALQTLNIQVDSNYLFALVGNPNKGHTCSSLLA